MIDLQKKYIDAYNRLLDTLAGANSSRLFWATDFASKNRFSCPLPDILEKLCAGAEIEDAVILDVRLKRMAGVFYHACVLAVRILKARRLLKKIDAVKRYVVIKVFIYDHSFTNDGLYKDVFLGPLLEHLKPKNNVLVYAQVLGDYDSCLKKMAAADVPMVPIEAVLSFKDVARAAREWFFTPVKVPAPFLFMGKDVAGLLRRYFDRSFKGVQMRQFIQYWAARNLARRVSIDTFYMTYENYPWERMTIRALREASPSTRILGIQHTVVPQAFLNYFTSASEAKEGLLPDKIFTTGEVTARIIREYSSAPAPLVQAGCALRFGHIDQIPAAARRPVKNILLALEASLKTEPMVRYVFEQLKDHPHDQVRIRTHPLLPWASFERRLGLKAGNNITVSNGSLKDDLQWADALVYWSTTVSMEALMMGKPVIHFDAGGVLSFDPLFECPHLKWKVNASVSLEPILNEINALSPSQFIQIQTNARQYLQAYFHPVTPQALAQL